MYEDWKARNPVTDSEKQVVNVEFVLKKIDSGNTSTTDAISNITLTDAAESQTLPATTSTSITTLLQTIRNNLKWLFNNNYTKTEIDTKLNDKAPINTTLTDNAESNTLPATTSTSITTLLQTIRNNLKWLFSKKQNKIDYADFNGTGITSQNQTIYKKSNGIEWIKKSSIGAGKYYVKFNRNASNIRIVGSATTDTDYQSEMYYHNILHFMQGRYDPTDDTVCISVCNKDGVQTDAAIIKICAFDT
jgi:predicted component of type VI protein secretion system